MHRGGNPFKKAAHAFAKLGVPNKTEFTIIRMYPGGGYWFKWINN